MKNWSSAFHSKVCYKNNFTFSKNEKVANVCDKCKQLKYNNDIKQIIKRSHKPINLLKKFIAKMKR